MADVIVVGAGVTGLTAAAELKRSGRRVLVLDAGSVAGGESQRTTAHLTEVLDTRFATLIRRFGVTGTRLILEGQRHAIDWIESQVRDFRISVLSSGSPATCTRMARSARRRRAWSRKPPPRANWNTRT